MSGSVNKVILIGCLGRDPQVSTTQDGKRIAKFSLATNERKDMPEWHNVVVFNDKLSEIVGMYAKKGSKIYVEGMMQTRKWTDKSNVERYTTEVVVSQYKGEIKLLDSSSGKEDSSNNVSTGYVEDDLPF